MSMLNAIRVAEENAESKRRFANEQVVIMLENAKKDAEIKIQIMISEADKKELVLMNINLQEIAAKKIEIDTANASRDDFIAKKSKDRAAKAIEFILGKVIKP